MNMKRFVVIGLCLFFILHPEIWSQKNSDSGSRKLQIAFNAISKLYVDETNDSIMVEDAINGILNNLDPHSQYMDAEAAKERMEPLNGNFDGIGIQYNMLTDTLYVIQVIPGGPSEKVGLMPGDKIIMVDDSLIAGVKIKTLTVMKLLRGPKGTVVRVKVMRNNKPDLIEFKITRDKIPVYSLDAAYMLDEKTGYIKLNRFAASSPEEFKNAMGKLKKEGMKQLILDLQGNGGGYLNSAEDLADQFLDKNQLIVYTQGRKTGRRDYTAGRKGIFEKGKMVVLVDEASASASEILTGALQDWDRAVVVGRRTFGKGLVQMPLPMPDGSMITLTVSRYYTPTGRCIQKPYQKGNAEEYEHDLINRYNRGELLSADSIHFPDSLKYSTLVSGRTVYGGGGIMPDVFIPLDTTRLTDYHRELLAAGCINRVAMNYLDKNREKLTSLYDKKHFSKYKSEFYVEDDTMDELVELGKNDSIPFNEEEFRRSEQLMRLQIKALIARDLFDMSEYYQVINDINDSLIEALSIINDEKRYQSILKN